MTTDFKRFVGYVRPYWRGVVGVVSLTLVVSGCTGAIAYAIRPLLDEVFINKDAAMLAWLPTAVLVVFFIKCSAAYIQSITVEMLASRVMMDLRNDFHQAMLQLPLSRFTQTASGEFISRMTNDIAALQGGSMVIIRDILQNGITSLVLVGVVIHQDPTLAVIALGVLPLAFYPLILLSKRLRKRSRVAQEAVSMLTQVLTETIGGIRVVKAFGAEPREMQRFSDANRRYRSLVVRVARLARIPAPMMEFVGALGVMGIMSYGGARVIAGETTAGAFFSFAAACLMLYGPLRSLSNANSVIQQSMASARRLFDVMDLPREQDKDDASCPALAPVQQQMTFENVTFTYDRQRDSDDVVGVHDINLTARVGEVVALVGPSGAGKTTLVHLIPRFLKLSSGRICVDGQDIAQVSLASLRRQIGIVGQDTVLFDDTVAGNIGYGGGGEPVSQERIVDAAKRAHAHDFIEALADGYDTRVGERGVMLSGGQRQRIAIARALLKDAPILILDEATSALDAESERYVQAALAELMANRTTFVIAHRLSTIRHASQILVMDQGRVVESGTHEQLLAADGLYRRLHNLQFQGER